MRDRPILFSGPMVRALIEGRKTQTRRVITPQPAEFTPQAIDIGRPYFDDDEGRWGQIETEWSSPSWDAPMGEPMREVFVPLPIRFAVGDRLWVRESWRVSAKHDATAPRDLKARSMTVAFEAGGSVANQINGWGQSRWPAASEDRAGWFGKLRPGIHMPRWASRLTLTVTDVRVQRLRDIDIDDAKAEGAEALADNPFGKERDALPSYRWGFCAIWASVNGAASWEANPWVVALTFEVMRANIDATPSPRPQHGGGVE